MSKRFWLLGLAGLILVAVLVACGNGYNPSQDGLLVVGSQGSGLIETFSFNLQSGGVAPIANSPNNTSGETCVLNGLPGSMVMDTTGGYAYVIFTSSDQCKNTTQTGIATFQVKSDGTITQVGNVVSFTPETVVPSEISIDAAGKFLFVADRATTDSAGLPVPGAVSVFAIGSGGSISEVPGSPFVIPTGIQPLNPDIISVAASPTVFPNVGINGTQNSVCQVPGSTPPTAEYLYAVDTVNYGVWEYSVNTSTGALGNPPNKGAPPFFASDKVPMGVAVDPCDRFVYVSDSLTNKVNAYQLCSVVISPSPCPYADGSLVNVSGSPFSMSGAVSAPGPIVVDPYGNNVYVVGTLSNTVSAFTISPITGAIAAHTPPTVATGRQPISIVIRNDDNWMFVTNFMDATVSQYSIAPATGAVTVLPVIPTDNSPFGVAVK